MADGTISPIFPWRCSRLIAGMLLDNCRRCVINALVSGKAE